MSQPSKAVQRRYRETAQAKLKKRQYYQIHKERIKAIERERFYRKTYGISIEQYNAILQSQNGKCKICGKSDPGHERLKHMCVDHCHRTGRIRGLLCLKCNAQLGWYEMHTLKIHDYLAE